MAARVWPELRRLIAHQTNVSPGTHRDDRTTIHRKSTVSAVSIFVRSRRFFFRLDRDDGSRNEQYCLLRNVSAAVLTVERSVRSIYNIRGGQL